MNDEYVVRVGHLAAAGELGHEGGVCRVPPGVDEVSGALAQPLPLPGGQAPHVVMVTEGLHVPDTHPGHWLPPVTLWIIGGSIPVTEQVVVIF